MTTLTNNQFRSTSIYGTFSNIDSTNGSILANGKFQRNLTIEGNLILGKETLDTNGNAIDSVSNIQFTLNKILYSIPLRTLSYINNVTSDIQTQINNISSNSGGGSINNFTNIIFTGNINSISKSTLDYIKNVSSDIQTQINSSNTNITNINNKITNSITDISWVSGTINTTTIANYCNTNILSFSQSLNNISPTTFGYLTGLTSNIQDQINSSNTNISTVEYRTRDISWTYGASNATTIGNYCNTSFLSFSQSLNNISTTTFGYLSGLTSNIQQQINNLNNTTPAGMVIAFAGTSNTLTGYLLCDGSFYNSLQYSNLFTVIGYTYGDAGNGYFKVPNYQAVFLRGLGSQFVAQPVVAGSGNPVGKNYTAPNLGTTLCDQSIQTTTSTYVNNVSTQVKTVVTGLTGNIGTYQTSNALSSLNFTTSNDVFNYGNDNTFPVHASVQYFIKY